MRKSSLFILAIEFISLTLLFQCKSNDTRESDGIAVHVNGEDQKDSSNKEGTNSKSLLDTTPTKPKAKSNSQEEKKSLVYENNEDPIKGVRIIGNFKLYNKVIADNTRSYKGDPKIEFLNNEGKVLKTINVLCKSS